MTFEQGIAETAGLLDRRLATILDAEALQAAPTRLKAAMRHALLGGGKRFRPFLVIESARLFQIEPLRSIHAAAAIECLHCYSLVHDDLPAMDNDDTRRGAPTVWKAFDVATAILAGDALQSLAFEILAGPETHRDASVRSELVLGLARASGAAGMAGGQQLDMDAEAQGPRGAHTPRDVQTLQAMKTGALICFAAEAGAILAKAPAAERRALRSYGRALGQAFQIADDLLDANGDAAVAGKSVGKDAGAGKATWISVLGVEGARSRLSELQHEAVAALAPLGKATETLAAAATFVAQRRR